MEKTRGFYEEVIGLPLVATWSESDELFGKVRTYCHCFFGLADGGALAFFQFAGKDDERTFSPPIAETPFHHIALKVDKITQEEIEKRINGAGYTEPDTFVLEHGHCRSVYIKDPNGMLLEFTLDAPNARSALPIHVVRRVVALEPTLEGGVRIRLAILGDLVGADSSRNQLLSKPPNKLLQPTASSVRCLRRSPIPAAAERQR